MTYMILMIRRRWLQVRCSNLQELVYKQGQAGITKATVSITFDNSNRATSPTGYEDKQKITVTRQVRGPQPVLAEWLRERRGKRTANRTLDTRYTRVQVLVV